MSSDYKESVIKITSSNSDNHRFGTGFIIHQDEHAAYLLTCLHVVKDVGGLQMVKAGDISATVIVSGEMDGPDLAVLRIEGLLDKPTLNLYAFGKIGSPFVTAGFQEFVNNDKSFSIRPIRGTLGEEIGLEYRNKAGRIMAWELKINSDYSLKPGYSGAPVIDEVNGYVLGVISHREGEKKGIAISIEAVERIWPKIPSDLIIKNQKQFTELRHKRISTGLEQQRQQIIEENKRRINQKRRRIVGQRPIDVAKHFRNRQSEQKKIGKLLANPETRIVSVLGRGGMGKTALASKVLSDLERNRWPHTDDEIPVDGIVYLSTRTRKCKDGISLERLFNCCATMLGGKKKEALDAVWANTETTIEYKVSLLLEKLSQGLYVILMDNIEDLLDDDGQIIDEDLQIFFEKCIEKEGSARLLVTSRICLAFRCDVMMFDNKVSLIKGLPTEDCIALLRELDPNGTHELRDASDKKLTKIVELVDGVPRALQVFASILANALFPNIDEVLKQFYGRDDVVQDLIEEGYKRLDNNARRVMDALSVFGCPVPVLAVDYLLEPFVPALDVPAIANRLIRTHFVCRGLGSKTLSLHPIDQDYAYSQLPEKEDYNKKALEHRAAKYYAQRRTPKESWQTIDDLEPQLAEFEHLVKGGDYVVAARLMNEIDAEYLSQWGYAQRVSNMRKKLLGKIKDKRLEMINLNSLGLACRYLGNYAMAIEYHRKALLISHDIRDKSAECISLSGMGHTNSLMGNYEDALRYLKETTTLARETGDKHNECVALDRMGVVCRNQGHIEMSIDYCNQALAIARKTKERQNEGSVLENLGIAHRNLGYADKSIEYLQQAMDIALEIGDKNLEGRVLTNFGYSYIHLKRSDEAIDRLQQALIITRDIFDRRFEGWALDAMGSACLSLGRIDEAVKNLENALTIHREINNRSGERKSLVGLSKTCLRKEGFEKAVDYLQNATAIDHELGNMREEAEDLCELGSISLQLKKYNQSLEYYRKAYTIFEMIGMKESVEKVKCHIKDIRDLPSVLFPNGSKKDI